MKIGFIGLGRMGSAMAANLVKAGHDVAVWNRSNDTAAIKSLIAAGAHVAATPAEAAAGEVVMSSVSDDRAVEAIVYGENGILRAPALHVSLSTISVSLAERLTQDQGPEGGYISACVFGRPAAAAEAKLFVVAAGDAKGLERCEPLLQAIGQRIFRVGDMPSAANLVKLSGNFMILSAIEAMSEAMTIAEKGGIPRQTLLEILTGTLFDAPVYRTYGDILASDRFKPAGFTAPLGLKDMNLLDSAANGNDVPMPLLGILRDHLRSAIAQEGPDVDWTGIAIAIRRNAGLL